MYQVAAGQITVPSPSWGDDHLSPYRPDSPAWRTAAAAQWNAGEPVRSAARKARAITDTVWPDDALYFEPCRQLASNLSDAALYLDWQGRHAEAVEEVRDVLHLADLLQEQRPSDKLVERILYGAIIRAIAANSLEEIASAVPLTNDPRNDRDLQLAVAHYLIAQLLATRKAVDILDDVYGGQPGSVAWISHGKALNQQIINSLGRVRTECIFSALSLACHVFQSQKGRWPADLNELVPGVIPSVPIDPWSDNTGPFGYIILAGRLPGGGDRPLLYCRCNSPDGLFFRIDAPQYAYYDSDGSDTPFAMQKHGGQFRDVARWQPAGKTTGPTTRPLP